MWSWHYLGPFTFNWTVGAWQSLKPDAHVGGEENCDKYSTVNERPQTDNLQQSAGLRVRNNEVFPFM